MVNLLGIQKKKKVNSRNEIHMLHARSWKKKEKQMNMHLMKIFQRWELRVEETLEAEGDSRDIGLS